MDSFTVDNSINVSVVDKRCDMHRIDWDDFHVILNGPVYSFCFNDDIYYAREGVVFNEGEDNVLEADWGLTWIYSKKEDPEVNYYYEQDPMGTAIHNFATTSFSTLKEDM